MATIAESLDSIQHHHSSVSAALANAEEVVREVISRLDSFGALIPCKVRVDDFISATRPKSTHENERARKQESQERKAHEIADGLYLSYARPDDGGKLTICVTVQVDHEDTNKPWLSSARSLRIESFPALPKLLAKIAEEYQRLDTKAVHDAAHELRKELNLPVGELVND